MIRINSHSATSSRGLAGWWISRKTHLSFPRWPSDTSSCARSSRRDGCQSGLRAAAGEDGISFAPTLELPQPLPVHATVAGERYEYDADCFFQANPFVLDGIMAEALRHTPDIGAPPSPASRLAIDLYCGVGLFTVPLARRFSQVIGVEGQPRAAEFGSRNLAT